jgi:hypothetical protein
MLEAGAVGGAALHTAALPIRLPIHFAGFNSAPMARSNRARAAA